MSDQDIHYLIRNTRPEDFDGIQEISREVYPFVPPWSDLQLSSHLRVFPEGQFVAVESSSNKVAGMAASLIVSWDDYEMATSWKDFTDNGLFTNHDPNGRTLYGAEIIVRPSLQGHGLGKQLYAARRNLCEQFELLRIRAGARLRGYHRYADQMSAEEYTIKVIRGELDDATLTFQLHQGFDVVAVIPDYLKQDPESLGYAAVIEWLNKKIAKPSDYAGRNPKFISNP